VKYLNITYQCQLRCLFCAANIPIRQSRRSMRFRETIKAISECNKGDYLVLSGGEPTLTPGFVALVNYANSRELKIILQTNGLRFSDLDFAEQVVDAGITEIGIPIYSNKPHIHDSLTGVQGSFETSIKAIKNILSIRKQKGKPYFELKLLISKTTLLENEGVIDLIPSFEFPPDRILLKFMVQSKSALRSELYDHLFISMTDAAGGVNRIINKLKQTGIHFWIDGYPLCLIDNKNLPSVLAEHSARSISGASIPYRYFDPYNSDGLNNYIVGSSDLCSHYSDCKIGHLCPGPEKTYVSLYGTDEIASIKKDAISV
jgi:Radical SAM superfamily